MWKFVGFNQIQTSPQSLLLVGSWMCDWEKTRSKDRRQKNNSTWIKTVATTGGIKVQPSCLELTAITNCTLVSWNCSFSCLTALLLILSRWRRASLRICPHLTQNEFQILILYCRLPDDALVSSILMYCVWMRQIIWSIHPNGAPQELHGQ